MLSSVMQTSFRSWTVIIFNFKWEEPVFTVFFLYAKFIVCINIGRSYKIYDPTIIFYLNMYVIIKGRLQLNSGYFVSFSLTSRFKYLAN